MRISCTQCDAQHEFPVQRLGEQIAQVRCAQCGHVFGIRRPAPVVDEPASFQLDLASTETYEAHVGQITESATGDDLDVGDLPGLDLQEGPREPVEQTPAPEPRRRSLAVPILFLLLAGTAAFVAYSAVMNPRAFTLFQPEALTGLFSSSASDKLAMDGAQKGAYLQREDGNKLFVITGWVQNNAGAPQGPVKVVGSAYQGAKKVADASAVCGVVLSEEELSALAPTEITQKLGAGAATVKPGEKIAFMIVIPDPPKGITQHSVEVAP